MNAAPETWRGTHALALDPNLAEARHYRGLVYLHVGLLDEAMQDLTKAVDLNPGNAAAHFRIGVAYLYRSEFQKALDKFETIDADFIPDFRIAQICLALIGLGRKEDARKYLDVHPTDSGGLITSIEAMVHGLFQREREAEEAIRRAETKRGFGHFHHTQFQIACAYALMDKKVLRLEGIIARLLCGEEIDEARVAFQISEAGVTLEQGITVESLGWRISEATQSPDTGSKSRLPNRQGKRCGSEPLISANFLTRLLNESGPSVKPETAKRGPRSTAS